MTDVPGVPLMLCFADCTPILLFDPVHRAAAIAHGGWKGTVRSIAAKTVRAISVSVPAFYKETRPIGKSLKKRALSVLGITVPLYLGSTAGQYRAKSRITQVRLFGVNLPLRLYEKTFTFLKTSQRKWGKEEQRQEAERILTKKIERENLRKAKVKEREYSRDREKLTMYAVVTAEEEITCEEKILFHAGN